MNKRKCGLKVQSLVALLVSFGVAILVFLIVDQISFAILQNYLEKSTYISEKSSEYMDSFETYITQNNIAADDKAAIDEWRDSNKKVTTIIYITRDGKMLYDSLWFTWQDDISADEDVSDADSSEQNQYVGSDYSENDWFFKREIEFSDGVALVSLYGYFDQWIYNASLIGEMILSVAVLGLVFICLIRRKINYILQLEEEIKVLETGGLNFPITVKGHDELTSLADSLNQMRLALSENMKIEAAAVKSNYDLVIAISHDLRTPLTSLILYLDLIHDRKYKNEEELNAYLEKSRRKVLQIKQMTDQLFEKFYLGEGKEKALEKPEYVKVLFHDLLSNMVSYLAENGFEVQTDIVWPCEKASVSLDYVNRILDNISSNILKYADPDFPVLMEVGNDKSYLQIQISNHMKQLEKKPDSTEVGIGNIQFMMDKMNGECNIYQDNIVYTIQLRFRLDTDKNSM